MKHMSLVSAIMDALINAPLPILRDVRSVRHGPGKRTITSSYYQDRSKYRPGCNPNIKPNLNNAPVQCQDEEFRRNKEHKRNLHLTRVRKWRKWRAEEMNALPNRIRKNPQRWIAKHGKIPTTPAEWAIIGNTVYGWPEYAKRFPK